MFSPLKLYPWRLDELESGYFQNEGDDLMLCDTDKVTTALILVMVWLELSQ
jgi:hypothetical protein